MKEGSQNPNTANYLGAIEFYNGHNLTFQSVTIDTQHSVDDPMFAPINSCPKPTCPIYADIVFVLDSSGSVTPQEWRETVYFVDAVMNSFTFGKNAVEAAVIHFCGQDASLNSAYKVKITEPGNSRCQKKDRWSADYNYPKAKSYSPPLTYPDDRMADYISTADYGNGPTVSPNREELMRLLNQTLRENCSYPPGWEKQSDSWREQKCENFPGWRGTCQALGLKLAMEVLDRSPRKDLNTKPHNIVIVVTDGEDKFPNMTARNATLIKKEPYDALLIEVGVGLDCEYDKNYLRNISSRLGSETSYAYFDAADYASIKRVVDELFKPLCLRNFASEEVERHNKPEIEIQAQESSSVANPVMITKSATEKILIETSINSVRLSLCVKQIDDVDHLLAKMFMRFLCQRADQFRILRRKPIEGYDISFLIMNVHTEQMVVSKLIQFIITFIKDIDKELSDMKVTLNKRARNCGEEYLRALV